MQTSSLRHALRWHLKKGARALVAVASRLIGLKPEPCVRILTYHRFGDVPRDPFCVTPADFDAQMQLRASEGRAVSLADVKAFVAGQAELPANACLVTIDDGMISTLETALPILEKHGVPAVAFVSSKLIGLDEPDLDERYMTWAELQQLAESRWIDIGSHAHSHRSMGELPIDEMTAEAVNSRQLLSEHLNQDIESFAYPFGMSRDFNARTDAALAEAGYRIAFNSMHGPIYAGMDPISLPRVKVEGGESCSMFAAISHGALDAWRMVDDRLWRLQRVRQEIG